MKETFFTKKGLYYRTNDFREDRETLVFIHGLSSSSSAWNLHERYFEDKYNILLVDLRGHGKSIKYKKYEDYAIKNFSLDIYELLGELNIKDFIFISHSFSTFISIEFMILNQTMIKKAIFLSPNHKVENNLKTNIVKILLKLTPILNIFPFSKKPGEHVDYFKYINTGDWNIQRLLKDTLNTGIRVYLYCIKQAYTFDRDEFLKNINIPVLIIHGKNDSIFPIKYAYKLHEEIKNSEIAIIDNADHTLVLNNFSKTSSLMDKFIEKR
jgi:pimeloyl-ACP methyl ester carboxylesterase